MTSLSVKIHSKVKEKLEKLKGDLGFQTISDTINCLIELYKIEKTKGKEPIKEIKKPK